VVVKESDGSTQHRLNHVAFLSRLLGSALQFRWCSSPSAISTIISYTFQIVFETPHSQIMHKITTRKDVKTNEVTPYVGIGNGAGGGGGVLENVNFGCW
jgi:hypothetical protein